MSRGWLIAVAGIVGVGKTTLAEGLGEVLGNRVIYEEYDKNPFLAAEFGGRKEAGLPSELFFLLSRARQLHRQAIGASETVVSDYVFDKNRVYAEMNLEAEELGIYLEVERRIESYLKEPDVVIYLYDAYEALFAGWERCPVVRVDCGVEDVREEGTVRRIVEEIAKKLQVTSYKF